MSTLSRGMSRYRHWLATKAAEYVAEHAVEGTECVSCGAWTPPLDRIARRADAESGQRRVGVSDYCVACRRLRGPISDAARRQGQRPWGTFDFHAWAQELLYPGVDYHALTRPQRQHVYWLARTRWASEGLYRVLVIGARSTIEAVRDKEWHTLRHLRRRLAEDGFSTNFPPYTDWLDHADDYADADGRHLGTLAGGGDDADPDGDLARAEAEVRALAALLGRGASAGV